MKKILLLVCATLVLSACNKWLDVTPKGQSTDDELFNKELGFKDALIGAYIRLKSDNLYGGHLTWGALEHMALNWDLERQDPLNAFYSLRNADYQAQNTKGMLEGIFKDQFKVVADVNAILTRIDAKKDIFSPDYYEIIKGEALGLRALAHFDAIRIFGPIPSKPGTQKWLPYVKTLSKEIHEGLTFNDYLLQVLADLDEAERLLEKADPVTKYTFKELKSRKEDDSNRPLITDDFLMDRELRFNFYAVQGLKARVYQWLAAADPKYGEQAFMYAKKLIDLANSGKQSLRLGIEADRALGDYTMTSEYLFGVNIFNLDSRYLGIFGEAGSYSKTDYDAKQFPFYMLSNLFPVSERTLDIRWKDMWAYKVDPAKGTSIMYLKYWQRSPYPLNKVPLIRLSEMYLIATEFASGKTEAELYYKAFCSAKGIPFQNGFNSSGWEGDRRNKLMREVTREFFAEGKSFLNYKRLNVVYLPTSWTYTYYVGSDKKYLVPKPDREIDYTNQD